MTKKMRELQAAMSAKTAEAEKLLNAETPDIKGANALLDEVDELQKEFETLERINSRQKNEVPEGEPTPKAKASGFAAMIKKAFHLGMTDDEKALITGDDATSGENNLVPEDVKSEIHELRKSYVSARDLVNVETTDALSGGINYESGTPAGLTAFDDGDDIAEDTSVSFTKKNFAIKWYGKLIPLSRILLSSEKSGLLAYLNRWFVKNAVLSENSAIFTTLKSGYNSGTPKAIAGWKALKKSITTDLDPSALIGGCIITNQSGFACLDEEEDSEGRPVLQSNPTQPTAKLFQGLPVHVFPDSQLANIDTTHFPVIYGNTVAGCTFVEKNGLEFAVSDSYLFGKNQNCMRVIEGFDVISTDNAAYIYGKFSATPST